MLDNIAAPKLEVSKDQKNIIIVALLIVGGYILYKVAGAAGKVVGAIGETATGVTEGAKSVVGATEGQKKAAAAIAAAQTAKVDENPFSPLYLKALIEKFPNTRMRLITSKQASKINGDILDKLSFTADLNPFKYESNRDAVVTILTQNVNSKAVLSFLAQNMEDVYQKNFFNVLNDAYTSGAIIQNLTHEPEKFQKLIEWANNLPNFMPAQSKSLRQQADKK